MNGKEFDAKLGKRNLLDRVDVLGSFDFYTTIIHLKALRIEDVAQVASVFPQMSEEDFDKSKLPELCAEQYISLARVLPLAIHEYTHFVDSTSTLWGLRHLWLMNRAYQCSPNYGGTEAEYHHAKAFFDHARGVRLPDYYTVVSAKVDSSLPWLADTSIGRIFDSRGMVSYRPVLFSRFTNLKHELIARSPISTVSILEASAMAQEMLAHAALLKNAEEDFRLVEARAFRERQIEFLYRPDITEYSVCAHILANHLKCKDALIAFRMCALLTRLALNFPQSGFTALTERAPIDKLLGKPADHEFCIAVRSGLANNDLGFLFYVLSKLLTPNAQESDEALMREIDVGLSDFGFSLQMVAEQGEHEARTIVAELKESAIKPLVHLGNYGYENFSRIGTMRTGVPFHSLNLAPALLGDDNTFQLFNDEHNALRNFDLESCYVELDNGQEWVRRFAEGCL